MPNKVPIQYAAKFTPLSQEAAVMALEEAVMAVVGKTLSKSALCVLLAQSALETGSFQKMPNYNWGGIKATAGYDYSEWGTTEGFGPNATRITAKFRAYPNAVEGAKDFVKLLANSPRYLHAWEQIEKGDPIQYAFELGKAGYYTGDPTAYAKGVARLWSWAALRMLGYGTTPDAIKEFQREHPDAGPQDGLLGPKTRAALKVALGG